MSRLAPILLQLGSPEKGAVAERVTTAAAMAMEGDDKSSPAFGVGDPVGLAGALPYLKTADPMPMLRPPDLVAADEVGRVVEIRPKGWFAVAFRRGTFLISGADLLSRSPGGTPPL